MLRMLQSGKQPHLVGETMLSSSESHKPFQMQFFSWDDVHWKRKCRILQNLTVVKELSEYKGSNYLGHLCKCAANGVLLRYLPHDVSLPLTPTTNMTKSRGRNCSYFKLRNEDLGSKPKQHKPAIWHQLPGISLTPALVVASRIFLG